RRRRALPRRRQRRAVEPRGEPAGHHHGHGRAHRFSPGRTSTVANSCRWLTTTVASIGGGVRLISLPSASARRLQFGDTMQQYLDEAIKLGMSIGTKILGAVLLWIIGRYIITLAVRMIERAMKR